MGKKIGRCLILIDGFMLLAILIRCIWEMCKYDFAIAMFNIRLQFEYEYKKLLYIIIFFLLGVFLDRHKIVEFVRGLPEKRNARKQKKAYNEEQKYRKELAAKEKRLENAQHKAEISRELQEKMEMIEDASSNHVEQVESFQKIEYIFTSNGKDTFTNRIMYFSLFLWVFGLGQLIVLLMLKHEDWVLLLTVSIFFGCYLLAFILFMQADRVNKSSQMYGIALVDVLNKQTLDLIEKKLYLVMSRIDLAGKVPAARFHITRYGRMKEIAEREKAYKRELDILLSTMKNHKFWENIEQNLKDEIIFDDCWFITPMRNVNIHKNGFYGSMIKYRDAKGVFSQIFLPRDFEDYKEVKKIINQWGDK